MAPNEIIRDEEDIIVIGNQVELLLFLIFGALILFILIIIKNNNMWLYFLGGIFLLAGLYDLVRSVVIDESVAIDRKLQNVMIKKYNFINNLESIDEIFFSDIESIRIVGKDCLDGFTWSIYIIMYNKINIEIADCPSISRAELIAKKICKMTNWKISKS